MRRNRSSASLLFQPPSLARSANAIATVAQPARSHTARAVSRRTCFAVDLEVVGHLVEVRRWSSRHDPGRRRSASDSSSSVTLSSPSPDMGADPGDRLAGAAFALDPDLELLADFEQERRPDPDHTVGDPDDIEHVEALAVIDDEHARRRRRAHRRLTRHDRAGTTLGRAASSRRRMVFIFVPRPG